MMKKPIESLFPAAVFPGAASVDPEFLASRGIKGVILDIDNTLVSDRQYKAAADISDWLRRLAAAGIRTRILSNSGSARVRKVCETVGIEGVHKARKPRLEGFMTAAAQLGLEPREIAVIGDQIFTDVYGANRAGMTPLLTVPIERDVKWYIRLKRIFEKPVLRSYRRREDKKSGEDKKAQQ